MSSQQTLVLPNDRRQYPFESPAEDSEAPQQSFPKPLNRQETPLERFEKDYLHSIVYRLGKTRDDGHPNKLHVFALQAAMMFLAGAVVFFLAGLCSVVFAPLAIHLAWNDEAKVRNNTIIKLLSTNSEGLTQSDRNFPRCGRSVLYIGLLSYFAFAARIVWTAKA